MQWDDADERLFAWARLDNLDNDPAHLLLHLATALNQIRPIDPAVLHYLQGAGRAETQLVSAFVQAPRELRARRPGARRRSRVVGERGRRHPARSGGPGSEFDDAGADRPAAARARSGATPTAGLVVEIGIPELKLSGSEGSGRIRGPRRQHGQGHDRRVLDKCEELGGRRGHGGVGAARWRTR